MQGLGVVVGLGFRRVFDSKTLFSLLVLLFSTVSTGVPLMMALISEAEVEGGRPCALSAAQRGVIRAAMAGNETCAYNQTLSEILGAA
jgi:hypothetical protein